MTETAKPKIDLEMFASGSPEVILALALVLSLACASTPKAQSTETAGVSTSSARAATPATTAGAPEASLAGLRIEVPCKGDKFGENNSECRWDPALKISGDPQWKLKTELTRTFGGDPARVYDVTMRVRGVVEPKNFTGGTVQNEHFQIGGTALVDNYNFYSIKVSDPAQSYTVNRHQKKTGHFVFPLDYTVTIPIRGGATVVVGAYDDNEIAIANHQNIVVPEVPPAPAPFDGHFFQLDVVSVVPRS